MRTLVLQAAPDGDDEGLSDLDLCRALAFGIACVLSDRRMAAKQLSHETRPLYVKQVVSQVAVVVVA